MKAILLILTLFALTKASSQIKMVGQVVSDKTNEPISNVNIEVRNDPNWTITDQSGLFEFEFDSVNQKEILFQSSILRTDTTIIYDVKEDTSVVVKLKDQLTFDQPCRKKKIIESLIIDIPSKDEYRDLRIKRENDLGFRSLISPITTNKFRIWVSPAFDYLGGYVYEGIISVGEVELKRTTFTSNYLSIPDSLRYVAMTEIDKQREHSIRFTSTAQPVNSNLSEQDDAAFRAILMQFKTSEDYCSTLVNSEYFCCLDGVMYDFEYRIDNEYKIVSFTNPGFLGKSHKQIRLFNELLQIIDQ